MTCFELIDLQMRAWPMAAAPDLVALAFSLGALYGARARAVG
jgi:hypothetical protein